MAAGPGWCLVALASCEAGGVAAFRAEQFSVRVDDEVLDNRQLEQELTAADMVTVPTAVAVFRQFIDDGTPSREWAERLYDIRRWTPMPRGGHFPAAEKPGLLSRDITAFFNNLAAAAADPQ